MGWTRSNSFRTGVAWAAVSLFALTAALYVLRCDGETSHSREYRALEARLLAWVHSHLREHWRSGTEFLPEGTYAIDETYGLNVVVVAGPPKSDPNASVAAVVQYDRDHASAVVTLSSGTSRYYAPEIDMLGTVATRPTQTARNSRTISLRMYRQ